MLVGSGGVSIADNKHKAKTAYLLFFARKSAVITPISPRKVRTNGTSKARPNKKVVFKKKDR